MSPPVPKWDNKERPYVPKWDTKERPYVSPMSQDLFCSSTRRSPQ